MYHNVPIPTRRHRVYCSPSPTSLLTCCRAACGKLQPWRVSEATLYPVECARELFGLGGEGGQFRLIALPVVWQISR